MVSKRVSGKRVLRINPKKALSPFYGEIVIYPKRQLVKKDAATWAKAKNVFWDIRPIVGRPSGLIWQVSAYVPANVRSRVPQF
jgi:hypothetical protein